MFTDDFLEDLEREDVTEEMLVVRQDLPRQIFFEEYEEDIKDVVLRRHSTYMLRWRNLSNDRV